MARKRKSYWIGSDDEDAVVEPLAEIVEEAPVQEQTVTIYYIGSAQTAKRVGVATGNEYIFGKDRFNQPAPVEVAASDSDSLLAEKGKGCFGHDPTKIFATKESWDAEVEKAKIINGL